MKWLITLLTITFVVLKALGYLNWSWWLVFSPVWGVAALTLGLFIFAVLLGILSNNDIGEWLREHFFFRL